MKALQQSMQSLALKATKNRVKAMQVLRGGIGSNLLSPSQIDKLIKQKLKDKEERKWRKVLGMNRDPRKSKHTNNG